VIVAAVVRCGVRRILPRSSRQRVAHCRNRHALVTDQLIVDARIEAGNGGCDALTAQSTVRQAGGSLGAKIQWA
jgi:hypothetical protein